MMFTKEEKVKAVRLLKAVRRLLKARQYGYVCWCLEAVGKNNDHCFLVEKLKAFIHLRLGRYHTVDDWLTNELNLRKPPNSKQMFEYRIRWVNSLIKEFS